NLEVMSQGLTRLLASGGQTIDSVLRVYDSNGHLLPYYGGLAANNDQLEGTDSSLLDVELPADGTYIVEVDSFQAAAAASLSVSAAALPAGTVALGSYELLVYTFATANTIDGIDTLIGGDGND